MSVADFLAHRQQLEALAQSTPTCWVIVANSVHAQGEHENIVAMFDTEEMARSYVKASEYPEGLPRNVNGRYRSFRPDSLLWDYNRSRSSNTSNSQDIVQVLRNPLVRFGGDWNYVPPINPTPPLERDIELVRAMCAAEALTKP